MTTTAWLISSRRDILKRTAVAAILAGGPYAALGAEPASVRKRVLRIAHVTDIHVQPELRATEGLTASLHHLQNTHKPDLIIGTGDAIMDSFSQNEARTKLLWELWQRIWRSECSTPAEHCIGNHDVWGIDRARAKTTGSETLYAKKWVMSINGWDRPYRSFDRAGWHFIALDSTMPVGDNYIGLLEEEQFQWLTDDLRRVDSKTPVLVFSHIPLLSASAFYNGENERGGTWCVPGAIMHIDSRRLKDLFQKYPNVKLCLSGHLHLVDRVDYLGVSYLCDGAVCGGWWKGNHQECEPGYGVIDLYADGTFENKYVTYGWKAQS